MAKVRQDAWSPEDDLLLAETVLRHVREGSTQLNAFEEVGDILNRTAAACGFRWNAEVRKRYESAMELAKRQRKERKRALAKAKAATKSKSLPDTTALPVNYQSNSLAMQDSSITLDLDTIIQSLQKIKANVYQSTHSQLTLDQLKRENEQYQERIKELEKKLKETENQLNQIQEDYKTFIEIMERARKMTVLDGQDIKAPAFRMDKNGNLEQIVQGYNS